MLETNRVWIGFLFDIDQDRLLHRVSSRTTRRDLGDEMLTAHRHYCAVCVDSLDGCHAQ
jgi:hypothetical protein